MVGTSATIGRVFAGLLVMAACAPLESRSGGATPAEVRALRERIEALVGDPGLVPQGSAHVGAARRLERSRGPGLELSLREPMSGVAVRVRPLDSSGSAGTELSSLGSDGATLGARALVDGADFMRVHGADFVEDFLLFEAPSDVQTVRYDLELEGATAGLRLVGGVLELLDASGTPRLRARRPWVAYREAGKQRREPATVDVEGCAVSRDPRPPYGERVVDPGQRRCTLALRFEAPAGSGPVVLDPLWTRTEELTEPRYGHTATVLANGKILLVGGAALAGAPAELYDPLTRTFAVTGVPASERRDHGAVVLGWQKDVLIAGGASPAGTLVGAVERYSVTTGSFSTVGTLAQPRKLHALVAVDVNAYVVGGETGASFVTAVEKYTSGAGMSAAGNLLTARSGHGAFADAGKILVVGGRNGTGTLASTEAYDTGTQISTGKAPLAVARAFFAGMVTDRPGGFGAREIFVLGGETGASGATKLDSIERYEVNSNTWTALATTLTTPRARAATHFRTQLAEPWVYLMGGVGSAGLLASTEVVLWKAGEPWVGATGGLAVARAEAAGAHYGSMGSQRDLPLVMGGRDGVGQVLASTERMRLSSAGVCVPGLRCERGTDCPSGVCVAGSCCDEFARGGACASDFECDHLSGASCVDGFCSTSACAGQCEACDVPGLEGICVPVSGAPRGGRAACDGAASATNPCGAACDGLVRDACGQVPYGTSCGASECRGDAVSAMVCDGAGSCGPALVTSSCAPYGCDGGACNDHCTTQGDCAVGYTCSSGGRCLGGAPAICQAGWALVFPDGSVAEDCAPYSCELGATACRTTCKEDGHCADGLVCTEGGDCRKLVDEKLVLGCQASGAGGVGWLAVVGLAAGWRRRRRAVHVVHGATLR